MERKWLSLFVCQAFVCFPVGQIYLEGRLSEVCRWKLATSSQACYTFIDSYIFSNVVIEKSVAAK